MTTQSMRNSNNRLSSRCGLLLSGMLLGALSLAVSSTASGQTCNDGCDALFGNTFQGVGALFNNGVERNSAFGSGALYYDSSGSDNTATGQSALFYTTTGNSNTASGSFALFNNTIGSRNVADGFSALYSNQTGIDNTATGCNALYANTGNYNTGTGYQALESNTTGSNNTAHGLNSLNANTTGSNNTANGASALFKNLGGNGNTAEGSLALHENSSGINNTALGINALYGNTTGSTNIGIGFAAGFSLTTGSNNIDICNIGVAAESNTIRIGTAGTQTATYIAGIKSVPVVGSPVTVGSTGQLGIRTSSARFKEAIKPMDKASEAILSLKPVTFRYKHELDPEGSLEFGLVAEEVEKVNPDLVACDNEGKPYTVRYEAVNAMLLNEFLKEHRKIEQQARINRGQQAIIAHQQEAIEMLTTRLNAQESQIHKISGQVKMNSPRCE